MKGNRREKTKDKRQKTDPYDSDKEMKRERSLIETII
jgi:hypothetical protein